MHPVELEVCGPPESCTRIRWSLKCVVLLSHAHPVELEVRGPPESCTSGGA